MAVYRSYRAYSPYNGAEVFDIDFEQTADVLYMAHGNHAPTKLIREGHYDWTFQTVTFAPTIDEPANCLAAPTTPNQDTENSGAAYFPQPANYVVTAFNENTGQESRASNVDEAINDLSLKRNYNTITWSAVTGATEYRIYKQENQQTFGFIGSTTSLTFRDDNIGPDLSEGPPVGDNPFTGPDNYPATVTFHEQRSVWAQTNNAPNGIWASRSADFENMDFTRPGRADDAFSIGLVAGRVNAVQQFVSIDSLLALTSDNIFVVTGANDDYIAATPPPRVRRQISRGSSRLPPLVVDNVVFYETALGSSIRTINYEFQRDGYKTDDVTIFSPHLFEHFDIVSWAYMGEPASVVLAVRSDGRVLCFTWEQEQQVWGWTLWETAGRFESVAVISEEGEDRAYFVVRRTIEGVKKRFIERLASEQWEDQVEACYLDCARTMRYTTATRIITHLEHLEGRTVKALADGNVVDELLVVNGRVTLPAPAKVVTVGLSYTALIETLPLAIETRSGWNVAKPQDVGRVALRVVTTRGIEAGPNEDNLYPVKQREQEAYGKPIEPLTGDFEIDMAGISGNESRVVVRSRDPLPMHIAAVLLEPNVKE